MKQYQDFLKYVMENGQDRPDRTGVGVRSIFGYQMRFDLNEGFPAVTTKKLAWKSVVAELLWFISGSTDERRLAEIQYGKPREEIIEKTTIWTANADHQAKNLGYRNDDLVKELGTVYGFNWRNFNYTFNQTGGVDQLKNIINEIKSNPNSRRLLVSAWNPLTNDYAALPSCHYAFQFYVSNNKLSCMFNMRSNDIFLGLPYNIASYALLTHMIARECNLQVGELIYSGADVHIYHNHFDAVNEQLSRNPRNLPTLKINDNFNLNDILDNKIPLDCVNYFTLQDYNPYPAIKAPMAV
jgi:thymidylate synthase